MNDDRVRREWLFLLVFGTLWAALIGYRVFPAPVLGIADNADFARLMCPAGLEHVDGLEWGEKYFYWNQTEYVRGEPGADCPVYTSTTTAHLWLAMLLAPGGETFDIRWVGLVNSGMLLLALLLVLAASRPLTAAHRVILASLLTLVFADIGYVVYMNSLYGEPASLQYLLLAAALVPYAMKRGWVWAPLGIALIGFALSKPQNHVLVPTALLFVPFVRGKRVAALLVIVAASVVSLLPLRSTDTVFTRMQIYDIVFYDLLPASSDPQADLAELGLEPGDARWIGTTAWEPGSPVLDPAFGARLDEVTYGRLGRFYLAHPGALFSDFRRAARLVFDVRIQGRFGHYPRSAGKPGGAQSDAFSLWSEIREHAFPRRLWFLLLFALANVAAIVVKRRRHDRDAFDRAVSVLHLWLLAVGAAAFVTTALAEGSLAPRHFFLISVVFDACAILLAMYAVGAVQANVDRRMLSASGA